MLLGISVLFTVVMNEQIVAGNIFHTSSRIVLIRTFLVEQVLQGIGSIFLPLSMHIQY